MHGEPVSGWLIFTLPAVIPLVMTLFNLCFWSRGKAEGLFRGRVSVLIPARNEESTIAKCVNSVLQSHHPIHEVIVYNDASEDRTAEILSAIPDPRLRVIEGQELPVGWVGKPHACHQLARHASGDLLVFLDADTALDADGLNRIASLIADCALLTAVPRQRTVTIAEQLVLPLLHLTYTAWLPQPLVHLSRHPWLLAANGQLLAVRRTVYDAVGGFASVRNEVVDDMAFCRHVKTAGHRVRFADGYHISQCRMYSSAAEVWAGFSKNLYEGIGGHFAALVAIIALYMLAFVVPYVAFVPLWLMQSPWATAAGLGIVANLLLRLVLAMRYQHSLLSVLLHPFAIVLLQGIALNSFRWTRRGQILWRGRVYSARGERG